MSIPKDYGKGHPPFSPDAWGPTVKCASINSVVGLVDRLRSMGDNPHLYIHRITICEAADMIEQMAHRIKADEEFPGEDLHHAD